ncbi:MAG: PLP-dependent aminotransferase family protein [bacterium]
MLYLLSEALLDPGDIVLVEAPTYFVFLGILESFGAQTIGLTSDVEGITPESLEETLDRLNHCGHLERVKFLYTMTYFANPTGRSWSTERKQAILSILRSYRQRGARLLLVEDGAYRYLDDDRRFTPTTKSYDKENQEVLYLESFSKCLAPGLKIGCAVGPRDLIGKMADLKGNHDFGTSNFAQQILYRALDSSWFDKHLESVCETYRRKRLCLITALKETVGERIAFDVPRGGFYLWMRLKDNVDTGPKSDLLQRALAEKVLYVPGEYCYSTDRPESRCCSWLRLSYGMVSDELIEEGVERLGRAIEPIRED